MIYIFDDKKSRQTGYNWTHEKFDKYAGVVHPIYQYSEVRNDEERKKIFSEGNVVLFHESFFDADFNKHDKDALKIRKDLEVFAEKNSKFSLVFFSGSKNERSLNNNVAYLPVAVLYQNLDEFIRHSLDENNDLRYLLYGKNPNIEHDYVERLISANNTFETKDLLDRNPSGILFARTIANHLPYVFKEVDYKILNGGTDAYFHEKTIAWFQKKKYDKIFIPLCFGSSLSDFHGLRFATHIRCTATPNQCTPIYIYSFVGMDELVNNECFNILKIKNVELIEYNLDAINDAIQSNDEPSELTELPQEMAKLKLDVPGNYEDNHSISNEWAIYRWANAIRADNNAIEKVVEKINTQLYFKYLSTIYPIGKIPRVDQNELRLTFKGAPKILYVDDDAEKGWYEILCTILCDINGFSSFEYLGDEIKKVSQEEIIEKTISKIREDDIDLVILDFRLHPDDFTSTNIQDITGFKLLQRIKDVNPGIQVIIFSATTKIWNLQGLWNEKVDAFIIKESPANSIDPQFTVKSIGNFITTIDNCLGRCFLKDFYVKLDFIKKELFPRKNYKQSANPLPKEFVDEVIKWLDLSYALLRNEIADTSLSASFLFLFSVLENLSNRIINVENPIKIEDKADKYKFEFRVDNRRLRRFIEDENNPGFYRRTKTVLESKRNLPWIYKILNTLDFITQEKLSEKELSQILKKRNDIVHANSTTGEKISINAQIVISLNTIIYNGLMNVK